MKKTFTRAELERLAADTFALALRLKAAAKLLGDGPAPVRKKAVKRPRKVAKLTKKKTVKLARKSAKARKAPAKGRAR